LNPDAEMKCPFCRTIFSLPPGGVQNLPNNLFILRLIQDNIPSSEKRIKLSINYCDQHPYDQNECYCNVCKVLMCHPCFANNHIGHTLSDVNRKSGEFRRQLDNDVKTISECQKQENLDILDADTKRIMEKVASTESEISQKYDQLISLIQSHQSQLMEELKSFKDNILKKIETEKDEIEKQFVIRESFKRYCGELINKGTACDISSMVHGLHARAEELLKTQDEHCDMSGIDVTFLLKTQNEDNFIGKLVLQGQNIFYSAL